MRAKLEYPSGAEFAFTILDDTDDTTLENGKPIYDFLREMGVRTTKTVWAFDTEPENQGPYFAGETLSSAAYLKWVRELVESGFEMAFHNATMGSSLREDTVRALNYIESELNLTIRLHCNHGQNRENLYWGIDRYQSLFLKTILRLYSKFHPYPEFEGDKSNSPYFWSDIADEKIAYIRAFAYQQLNGRKIVPGRPFLDLAKQKKTMFFNTADAPDVIAFNKLVNRKTLDRLCKDGGWAIVSTHLGKGFYRDNKIDSDFKKTMKYLAKLPCWFVPVSELLDFIKVENGSQQITYLERVLMEYSHILDRIKGRIFDTPFYEMI